MNSLEDAIALYKACGKDLCKELTDYLFSPNGCVRVNEDVFIMGKIVDINAAPEYISESDVIFDDDNIFEGDIGFYIGHAGGNLLKAADFFQNLQEDWGVKHICFERLHGDTTILRVYPIERFVSLYIKLNHPL